MPDSERTKQDWVGVFSRAASTYDHVGPAFFAYYGRRLVELAHIPAGARVLDVASGRGAVLFPAAQAVGTSGFVTGIDLAEGMIQETGREIVQRDLQNAEIRRMDAENLEFPDSTYDVLTCGYAIFFFPHLDHVLAEFRRVLKPGGRIALSTWAEDNNLWKWYDDLLARYRPPQPESNPPYPGVKFNTPAAMQVHMEQGGFVDIQVFLEQGDFVYANEEEWWATLWSHGGRRNLETFAPDVLAKFKAEAFELMRQTDRQPDGYHRNYPTLFTLAKRLAD